jgi:hypothetical protein
MKLNNFLTDKRLRNAPDGGTGLPPDPNAAPPAATPAPAVPASSVPGPDLSFIPADYLVDGKPDTTKFSEHYTELVADAARRADRLKEVPTDGVYDYTLPQDFSFGDLELPEGFTVQVSDDPAIAPLLGELGTILKELDAPKEAGQKIAGLIARYEATKFADMLKAQAEDLKVLGTPAQVQARKDALKRVIDSRVPADLAQAIHLDHASAAQIKVLEALAMPRTAQVPPARPSAVDTEGMSAYDMLKAANAQQARA